MNTQPALYPLDPYYSSYSSILNNYRITKATIAGVISVVKVIEDFNKELVEDSNKAILIIRIRLLLSRILIYSKE